MYLSNNFSKLFIINVIFDCIIIIENIIFKWMTKLYESPCTVYNIIIIWSEVETLWIKYNVLPLELRYPVKGEKSIFVFN